MKKDSYYTYTNYVPCKPVAHKICWIVPVLVLAAVLALGGAVYYGAVLLSALSALGGF